MAIETNAQAVEEALGFITENATLTPSKENKEKPDTIVYRHSELHTVNQGPYIKFMKTQGVTPEVLSSVTDAQRAWNTAAAKFASARMEAVAPEAVKDKEFVAAGGMKRLQTIVKTSVKDGSCSVGVKAFSENPIPNTDPQQMSQKFGVVAVRHKLSISKVVDSEAAEGISVAIESLVRGKF